MKTTFIIALLLNLPAAGGLLIAAQEQDTTNDKPVQYRRGIALQEGYISYDEYYSGKDMLEEKRRLFPIESTGVWTELNPKVPRVDYIGVDFINPDTGWAVGLWGAVIKTTNAGQSWKTIPTPTAEILLKVHSYNGQVVMVVGHNGTILRSSDGGESFSLLTGITTQELWGIKMLNDTLGWICGRNNTLLKTTDAGLSWQAVVTGYNYHYWQFDFLTEDYFMIACSQGRVLKTTNGGQSFTEYQAGSTQDLYTIDIIDSLHIAAAGNYGKNVYSSDGGINWVENTQLTSSSVNWVQFINIEIGFAAVESSWSLYKTTDRGQSWSLAGFYKVGEWQFELLNENIGYGVGAGLKVTKTEDGFNTGYNLFLNKNWSDVFFINEMKGFFASASLGEKLYKTEDGGITYEIIENSPEWNYDILFLDSLTGFSGSSTIYKTTDGGENWYSTNGAGQATKIFFINPLIGWAVGGSNIYKTTDGGENWFVQITQPSNSFTSIHFVDSLYGWATILGSRPYKTTDGGINWIQQTSLNIWESDDVYFVDSLNGFIIDTPSKLYRTLDGGDSWMLQLNSQYVIRNFSWINSIHGFIMGDGVFETSDGGNTWDEILEIRNVGLRKFHAPLNYLGYSVGNQGLIYKYADSSYIPVEIVSFTGFYEKEKIMLSWVTASEINNNGFEIQKSKDKEIWQTIGFVNGSGSSTEFNNYNYIDNTTLYETNYYRLKQIDYDGTYKYSQIIEISLFLSNFQLYQNFPNPFNPNTTIKYIVSQRSFVRISLYDIRGEKVADLINEEKQPGIHSIEFTNRNLSSGIYLYRMITSYGYNSTKKLIILK